MARAEEKGKYSTVWYLRDDKRMVMNTNVGAVPVIRSVMMIMVIIIAIVFAIVIIIVQSF